MALTKKNTYTGTSIVPVDNAESVLDKTKRGLFKLSLTHMDDALRPSIASGSVIDVAGNLLLAEADELIPEPSGITSDEQYYVISINRNTGIVSCSIFTIVSGKFWYNNSTIVWNNYFQGWYESADNSAVERRIAYGIIKNASSPEWIAKLLLDTYEKKRTVIQSRFTVDGNGIQKVILNPQTGYPFIDTLGEITYISSSETRIVFKNGGLYLIKCSFTVSQIALASQRDIVAAIYKNGSELIRTTHRGYNYYSPGRPSPLMLPCTHYFNSSDYIQPYLEAVSGNIISGYGYISVLRINYGTHF